jgi:ribosome maturation factor RimP
VTGPHVADQVRDLVEPLFADSGLELVDVEVGANLLRITVDRPGGIDLDTISAASRAVSEALDRDDPDLGGRYVLEVSSPGVERALRTPDHFRRFVGTPVAVKTRPGVEGDRRVEGTLEAADDAGIVVDGRSLRYEEIERARTRFVWPPVAGAGKTPKRKAGASR